ncbi:unnamed protein product [Miscanthus lutarioriparius]|uniref:Prolyl endopeptidase n=1 Tax=Miscanthus lutarioriparius TaxID=422564 RepID=A0A811NHH7_9POAL|nr:unnamed protein product [Miscanthus lutarioriparius]
MRDTSDPDLAALLAAENAYADAFVGSSGGGGLRARLAAEMRARLPASATTPPQPWGPWLYYQYVPEGKEYPVLSRKLRPSSGLVGTLLDYLSGSEKEQVLLDWNEVAEKNGYVHIGTCRVSPDHRFLAYTVDTSGGELFSLEVKDLLSEHVIFSPPNKGIVFVIESDNLREGLWPIRKRVDKVQYFLEHHNGFFYILTNAPVNDTETTTEGYYLARCRAEKSLVDRWQIVTLPTPDCTIQDMDIFHDNLVLYLQKNGTPLFCSINMPIDVDVQEPKELDDLNPWFFPIPSELCSIVAGSNNDFMSSTYRLVVSSPVIPDLTVDYDLRKKTFTILNQEEVTTLSANLGSLGFQSNASSIQQNLHLVENSQSWSDLSKLFSCQRIEVISHDGVSIPLVILYSREAHFHGESPGILYGYGAYGEDLDKSWCSERLSLLSRGWVLAFADVRGTGQIYDSCFAGLEILVFIQRVEGIYHGIWQEPKLVGAVINMLPDLFSAAVLKVPFLDICNTMLDPTLPLTVLDYEEFGDPNIPAEFEAISSYSPYDNLAPGVCYPPVLVTASFNDTRVGVWEAAKWVAKVRDVTCRSCSQSVILKTNMQSGHFGEGGRFMPCDETAFEYTFLMKALDYQLMLSKIAHLHATHQQCKGEVFITSG